MPNAAGFDRRTIIAKGSALDRGGAAVSEAVAAASRLSVRGQDAGTAAGEAPAPSEKKSCSEVLTKSDDGK